MAEKYRRWSTYNYGVDNPIRFTDPDGMGATDWVRLGGVAGGAYLYDANVHSTTDAQKAYGANATDVSPADGTPYVYGQSRQVALMPDGTFDNYYSMKQDPTSGQQSSQEWNAEFQKTSRLADPALAVMQDMLETEAAFLVPGAASSGEFVGDTRVAIGAESEGLDGSFSVSNWDGYPTGGGGLKPSGPFRLLEGDEYQAARATANDANAALRSGNQELSGLQIHEIQPIKFNGSPTSLSNKIPLTPAEHAQYTTFWNRMMREIQ